ncbi:MAG TPA: hypothetical protein VHU91_00320, partial [Mycobacteriales bacterium]|nr:hypothetical protein [Mycobacteriales bacterium]
QGGFDHGTLAVGDHRIPYLNEYLAVEADGARLASYPDTIALLSLADGRPVAIKDAADDLEVALVVASADDLPRSSSARDVAALREVEEITQLSLVEYL